MSKRQAETMEPPEPKRSRSQQTPDDLLSILARFIPLVLARVTRDYMGLSGRNVQELKLDFPLDKFSPYIPNPLVSDDSHVAFFQWSGDMRKDKFSASIWDLTSPLEPRFERVFSLGNRVGAFRQGQLFRMVTDEIEVYDMTGTLLRRIPYPDGTRLSGYFKFRVYHHLVRMLLHKDQILLIMQEGDVHVIDAQDGKQIRTLSLPAGDDELVSVEGRRLYAANTNKALIHEISDRDGSCLRAINVKYESSGIRLSGIRVLGELYDELYVFITTDAETLCGNLIHAYSLSTGQFLRSVIEDISSVALLPHGYALVKNETGLFLME